MDLINGRHMEHVKNYWFSCSFYISDFSLGIINVSYFMLHEQLDRKIFFFPQCPHMSICGLRGPPSCAWQECNRLLRFGRPWGAVTLSQWCVWVVIEEDVVPGGALNLKSTNLPRPWSPWESSPTRKIPMVEPGIEPGTSWLVARDSDQ